jgi:CheY-like chemotaxis protein
MMAEHHNPGESVEPLRVLLVDHDEDVRELVQAVLSDEGYEVTSIAETDHDAVVTAVGRLEPDCILLDGAIGPAYGAWTQAAYLSTRARSVPTIMFTAHADAVDEARKAQSDRSRDAGFAEIVGKPFGLDELLDAVERAAGRSRRFDRSDAGDQRRNDELVESLTAAGATDIRTSGRREWATFVSAADQRIYQLYWWQRLGVYMVGRYDDDAHLSMMGRFLERNAAIRAATEAELPEPAAS